MKVPKKQPAPPIGHPPYNVNGEGGRPEEYTLEKIDTFADELIEWFNDPTHVFLKDFCLDKKIDPDYMVQWSKKSSRFLGAYKLAKHKQESRLLNGGLLDEFNAGFAKFLLINNHGYAEKTETKVSGDAENPFSIFLKSIDGTSKELVDET